MQVVIEISDIPKNDHERWARTHGIVLPDNATNGDVLKIMFTPNRITRTDDIVNIEYNFTPEWWNTPYQKGGK